MILSRFGWWMLVISVAVLPLGCSAFDDDNDDDRATPVSDRSDLPSNADRVVQAGKGDDINWRAKSDGTVYLVDRDNDRVIYTGSIRDGHRLEVDVSRGTVTNNGVEVSTSRKVSEDNRYNLYFVP